MLSQTKNTCFCLVCILLGACSPGANELASYLEGHWEGSYENRRWCVTYVNSNEEGNGGEVYLSSLDPNGDQPEDYLSTYGKWDALRGGRVEQLMEEERKIFYSYLLFDLEENEYSYTNAKPDIRGDNTYSNKRVGNCPMHESLLKSGPGFSSA